MCAQRRKEEDGAERGPSLLDVFKTVPARVRGLRSARNYTQTELADEVSRHIRRLVPKGSRQKAGQRADSDPRDVSYRTIQRVEEGDTRPLADPAFCLALAKALGVEPNVLFPDDARMARWREIEGHMHKLTALMREDVAPPS